MRELAPLVGQEIKTFYYHNKERLEKSETVQKIASIFSSLDRDTSIQVCQEKEEDGENEKRSTGGGMCGGGGEGRGGEGTGDKRKNGRKININCRNLA